MRIVRGSLGVLLAAAASVGLARGLAFRQFFAVYPPTDESKAVLRQLHANDADEKYEFAGKAKVSLRTERIFEPVSAISIPCAPGSASAGSGWTNSGRDHVWAPRGAGDSLSVSFSTFPAGGEPRMPAQGRSELWIDYADLAKQNAAVIALTLKFSGRRFEAGRWRNVLVDAFAGDAYDSLPRRVCDVPETNWRRKDVLYTLRKWLRMPPDGFWRFASWRGRTVMQRRFHEPLNGVGEMDLVFRSGAPVHGINLRVASRNNFSAGELIELGEMNPERDESGRWVVHVDVRALTRQRFPDSQDLYLQELTFFGGLMSEEALGRLRQVIFRRSPIGKAAMMLPARVLTLGVNRKRLIVDLRPAQFVGADLSVKSGLLSVSPMIPERAGGLRVESVRLVSISERSLPRGLETATRWGAPFIDFAGAAGVESSKIDAYFPFSALSPEEAPFQNKSTHAVEFGVESTEPFVVRAAGQGLSIQAERKLLKAESGQDGISLEGFGRWIDVDWPIAADADPASRLFIGLDKGERFVKGIHLTLDLENGGSVSVEADPNRAVVLGIGKARIKRVRAHFEISESPFRVRLTEMALFRPRLVPAGRVLDDKFPALQDAPLIPTEIASSPSVSISSGSGAFSMDSSSAASFRRSFGSLTGVMPAQGLAAEPLSWTTRLDRPVDWVIGLRLAYRMPIEIVNDNPCWLNLTFEMDRGRIERPLCARNSSGEVFLPWKTLLGAVDYEKNLGALHSIRWTIRAGRTNLSYFEDPTFGFEAAIKGVGMESLRDDLRSWGAVTVGTQTVASASPSRGLVEGMLKGAGWLDIDRRAVRAILANGEQVGSAESPYFKLDAVMLTPRALLPQDAWSAPSGSSPPVDSPRRRLNRVAGLALVAGLVFFWRRRGKNARHWLASVSAAAGAGAGVARDAVFGRIHPRHPQAAAFIFWTALAGVFYLVGFWKYGGKAEIYCVSLGALSLVPALFLTMRRAAALIGTRAPGLSAYVDKGVSRALAGALLMIVAVAVLTVLKLDKMAEQAGDVAYYCLLIAAFVYRSPDDSKPVQS